MWYKTIAPSLNWWNSKSYRQNTQEHNIYAYHIKQEQLHPVTHRVLQIPFGVIGISWGQHTLNERWPFTSIATLLAKVPRRRGAANGSTNVLKMKILKSHPDSASHTKRSVCIKKVYILFLQHNRKKLDMTTYSKLALFIQLDPIRWFLGQDSWRKGVANKTLY